jgi:hypothetical protein
MSNKEIVLINNINIPLSFVPNLSKPLVDANKEAELTNRIHFILSKNMQNENIRRYEICHVFRFIYNSNLDILEEQLPLIGDFENDYTISSLFGSKIFMSSYVGGKNYVTAETYITDSLGNYLFSMDAYNVLNYQTTGTKEEKEFLIQLKKRKENPVRYLFTLNSNHFDSKAPKCEADFCCCGLTANGEFIFIQNKQIYPLKEYWKRCKCLDYRSE